ncbi:AraC family transcriptional regulator [Opitutus terrae]|uniref:Transcriptional regulator, AraC family n=1 Tax=Opitutus terrae (strain DSM 11246 / JCM 15787 / PB90-1) TaxID=452637 RepID=B1ZQ72_OPITP|nr:AraC family transcriptional regulator [Opitutus terrae]ACB77793.1 transcriptional regulator, AraC family [Opitutus terrae PB90-1]
MSSDTLSDVLHAVRLTGAVFFDVEAHAPWSEASPAGSVIAPQALPSVQHVIAFHVVTEGRCWVATAGLAPVALEAGDIVVFPQGDAHTLYSEAGPAHPVPLDTFARARRSQLPLPVHIGTQGMERTHLVCGYLGCDVRPFNPLIATLPRILHVRDRAGATHGWLSQFISVALAESREKRPGGESVLSRLSELMFIEVVRRHVEAMSPQHTGWLAGLRDEFVGRALAVMHREPARNWSLEELALAAGRSRSAFAERFAELVGQPPMQYLAHWRMQVAAGLLARGAKVSSVALEVGYDSEAAFSRAFKKLAGTSPGAWRLRGGEASTAVRSDAPASNHSLPLAASA